MSVSTEVNKADGRHDLSEEQPRFRLLEAILGHDVVKQLALGTVLKHTNKTWLRQRERERNVLFTVISTVIWSQTYVKDHSDSEKGEREKCFI